MKASISASFSELRGGSFCLSAFFLLASSSLRVGLLCSFVFLGHYEQGDRSPERHWTLVGRGSSKMSEAVFIEFPAGGQIEVLAFDVQHRGLELLPDAPGRAGGDPQSHQR